MPTKLTEKSIAAAIKRAAKGARLEISDETLPGLRLRVTARGRATWVLACRDPFGRMRRFQVGTWPSNGIASAREAAREMRVTVRAGADPIAESKRTRALGRDAKAGIGTLHALLGLYGTKAASKHKSWPVTRRRIETVFGSHLQRPLRTMTRQDLQVTADGYKSAQQASVAVSGLRPVLKWAASRDYIDSALIELIRPAVSTRRDRVLTRGELERLLPVISDPTRPYAAAIRFMLLTLARREEVCGAQWQDIDLKVRTWRIDAPRTKNGVEHIVPLSRQALALLGEMRKGGPESLIFAGERGGRLQNWDREGKIIMAASNTTGWTRHDLRRTGATMLGDMGETPDVVEAALNHVSIRSQIAATYNRSRYRPQVAIALQRLADALDGIAQGGADVVPLRAASK